MTKLRGTAPMDGIDAPPLLAEIRDWISAGQLAAGARLPPERAMAKRFGVTRADLRKSLAIMEEEGHIERHIGRGTFVTGNLRDARPDGRDIAERTSPLAAMQARSVVEPELARLAALNATSAQLAEMQALCAAMRAAPSWDAYVELDWRFHNVIAEATGNILLAEIQRLLNGVRRFVVWGNLIQRDQRPPRDYHSFDEHQEILAAIAARDPERAMAAMLAHLGGTRSQLNDYRQQHGVLPTH